MAHTPSREEHDKVRNTKLTEQIKQLNRKIKEGFATGKIKLEKDAESKPTNEIYETLKARRDEFLYPPGLPLTTLGKPTFISTPLSASKFHRFTQPYGIEMVPDSALKFYLYGREDAILDDWEIYNNLTEPYRYEMELPREFMWNAPTEVYYLMGFEDARE